MNKWYKKVNYIIIVPKGDYCWEAKYGKAFCEHFDNEGGHSRCMLNEIWNINDDNKGALKSPQCRQLEEIII